MRSFVWTFLPTHKKYPPFIIIDPIVKCNLNCPMCSVPPKTLPRYGSKLSLEEFTEIFEKIKNSTNRIGLAHAGEPFLNSQLIDMIELINKAGLISAVGTNATLFNKKNIQRIIKSELDILLISFDGFSKESYEKYRVRADFDKVLANITKLAVEKRKRKARKPVITVTYLVNAYNSHEVNDARDYFTGLGIKFQPKGINLNVHRRIDGLKQEVLEHWLDIDSPYSIYKKDEKGNVIFKEPPKLTCDTCEKPVITCSGDILICCHDIFESVTLGNIKDIVFKKFWLSKAYRNIRKMASQRKLRICRKCGK